MAAGDVAIKGHTGRAIRGHVLVWGEVQLDGANPTPVDLSRYLRVLEEATVALKATSTPGDDPIGFSVGYSGATLNIYAYKTDGSDPTWVASTDNAAVVSFIAIGQR